MKKLVCMTNREYIVKYRPDLINNKIIGGVFGCPNICFRLENTKSSECGCMEKYCEECWNLPAKKNGKYIMKVIKYEEISINDK